MKVSETRDARYQSLDDADTRAYVRRHYVHQGLDDYVVQLRKEAFEVAVYEDKLRELFTREAEWIAELERRAAKDPAIAEERIQAFRKALQ